MFSLTDKAGCLIIQSVTRAKMESGEIPVRSRHCDRGAKSHCHWLTAEKGDGAEIRESGYMHGCNQKAMYFIFDYM